jgi:D-alanyl-D-alanine carboxypeptidase (penicillin-binding protein 5/6)
VKKGKKVLKITKTKSPAGITVWQGIGLGLAALFFFMLPGQDYYQTLQLRTFPPRVRNSAYDNFRPSPYPVKITSALPPLLTASAAAVIDLESGVPLFQKNAYWRLRPASLTKLMTALVALDYYRPDDVITVSKLVTAAGDSKMGLKLGDQLTVRHLLYGLLLPSGNDAAYVLADNIPGGFEQFIYSMNQKAEKLHMFHTHFNNPSGRDEDNHYSTMADLLILAKAAIDSPLISQIVKTSWFLAADTTGGRRYPLQNINQLLVTYPGVYGIKTGYTELAGQCLLAAAEKGRQKLLVAVLNSRDRFRETASLLDWGFTNFRLTEPDKLD